MRSRWAIVLPLLLAATAFACQGADVAEPEATTEDAAEGEDHGHGGEGNERDAYSKPDEVYAFLGIGEGSRVLDLMAGGGYNAERLAMLVGADGHVIAERPSEEFTARVTEGDLAEMGNIALVGALSEVEDGSVDAVVAVRAYHLFPDVPAILAELDRVLVPGGVVGVVEVRLNEAEGHDMTTHRVGEQTVIADFEAAGFEYVGESDLLRRDDDDYGVFSMEGRTRFMTDRMLLSFRKPGGPDTD